MKFWIAFVVSFLVSLFLTLWIMGCGSEPPQKPSEYLRPAAAQNPAGTTRASPTPAQNGSVSTTAPVSTYGHNQPLYVDSAGTPHMRITETGSVIDTEPASGIEHGVRQVSAAARYGTAWVLMALGILIPGPLVILFVPGFIVGRSEKIIEGLAIGAWGLFMLNLGAEAHIGSLYWWVWGVLVVPGALLLLWGLVSDNEGGKFVLVTGPVIVFALYLFSQLYRMVVLGAAGSAVFTFLIILLAASVLIGAVSRLGGQKSTA